MLLLDWHVALVCFSGSPEGLGVGGRPGKASEKKAGAWAQEEEEERVPAEEGGRGKSQRGAEAAGGEKGRAARPGGREQKKRDGHRVQQGGDGGQGIRRQDPEEEEQEAEHEGQADAARGEELQAAARPRGGAQGEAGRAAGDGRGEGPRAGGEDEVDQRALQGRGPQDQRRRGHAAVVAEEEGEEAPAAAEGVGRSQRERGRQDAAAPGQEAEEHPEAHQGEDGEEEGPAEEEGQGAARGLEKSKCVEEEKRKSSAMFECVFFLLWQFYFISWCDGVARTVSRSNVMRVMSIKCDFYDEHEWHEFFLFDQLSCRLREKLICFQFYETNYTNISRLHPRRLYGFSFLTDMLSPFGSDADFPRELNTIH